MQAAEESVRKRQGGAAGLAGPAPRAMPDAETRRMFISLIDPAAMARTDRCVHTAELIGAYSAGAGWNPGVRLARLLGEIFRDMSRIADRPDVGDSYWHALHALGDILAYLRRDGRDVDPMEGLEEVRSTVAQVLDTVSKISEPGREPDDPDMPPELVEPESPPQTCRNALVRSEWALRKRFKERGVDHVFPPRPRAFLACCPNMPSPTGRP